MTEQILSHFRTQVSSLELIPSFGGVFEVSKDGEKVFSKRECGRFPEWHELRGMLES